MPKVQEGVKYEKKYKEEDVIQALKAIENGISQRRASQIFKVPRQTLQFRKSEKFQNNISLGPNTILTSEEEATLEEWILTSYRKGFPLRKLDIQMSVKDFLDLKPRENPFQDNLPGEGWYRAFLKRHPALTHRRPEAVTSASSIDQGHSTHQTLKLSQLCTSLEIILIALYPNATRNMQPADVAAFKPLKTGWKRAVLEFRRKNPNVALTKEKFAPLLNSVIEIYTKADTIKNGFRASGLHPWNASSIDYSKCLGTRSNSGAQQDCNKQIEVDELTNTSSMMYDQFKNIVGEQRIELFERIEQFDEDSSDEFIILYKLYREFKKHDKNWQRETPTEPANSNDILVDMETDHIEIIFQDSVDMNFNEKTNTNITKHIEVNSDPVAINAIECNMTKTMPFDNQPSEEHEERDKSIEKILTLERELEINNQTSEHITERISMQELTNLKQIGNCQSPLRENTEANAINTSLRDFVLWPKTPERKGKKQSERLPFVLTSSGWKKNSDG
ncbi:tc5 transposase dna-binding domain [Holotrichia oblita]|uniref:Tc5 transposase dna-binding domain n=1 Tax=Holotrichia oblita TaxID=644536 RepID=A0ACB9T1E8_HOLOL|nr:tc5 transposase dna-binding domain [Holotrichia oblita]